ncbi:GntR family transcriptional regulator [Marinicellulosiphila megalodicopiae]|uniref:GntR family transcriptional regulator n=1 Tax=Marinicellulosiphila megalodicopiae TaxID=2724896 RepID=UPI003BAEF606
MTQRNFIHLLCINTSTGIPIYRQLIDQIKQAIAMQLIAEGQTLPSVRNIATSLQINPMTISKAYSQLELEGILIRKPGIGMIIAKPQATTAIPVDIKKCITKLVKLCDTHRLDPEVVQSLIQQSFSIYNKEK